MTIIALTLTASAITLVRWMYNDMAKTHAAARAATIRTITG